MTGFDATGCGAPYALGVLAAQEHSSSQYPHQRVWQALEIAARFSAAVSPPFCMVRVRWDDKGMARLAHPGSSVDPAALRKGEDWWTEEDPR